MRGLLNSAAIDAARAPAPLLTISELRVTAQEALDGTAVSPLDTDAMHALGAVLARLQAVEPAPSLPPFTPARHLDIAGATAIHVGQLLPDLQEPVDALLERLRAAAPANGPLVVAHGDLHLDQALLMGGDIALLDFDAATVAAHLITGAPGDLDAAAVVVDALCDGMGGHPPGLVWHLAVAILRRATYPFRLVRRDWPERMRETVRVADQLASQGALLRDTATA